MVEIAGSRVNELLERALELPDSQREEFLRHACGADEELFRALLKLLHHVAPTDDFLEGPILGPESPLDARLLQPGDTLFRPGDVLAGRFRIVRFIARGGMGEVYEATDGELGIAVALKTIRAALAADDRAVSRFRSEVRQARAVAHPNVCK